MKSHLDFLQQVADQDVHTLLQKEKSYGASWKKRGGVGAFMMLARKWDRIENQALKKGYDIFAMVEDDKEGIHTKDGTLDDIRDLRCYLMLVEAELIARHAVSAAGPVPAIDPDASED